MPERKFSTGEVSVMISGEETDGDEDGEGRGGGVGIVSLSSSTVLSSSLTLFSPSCNQRIRTTVTFLEWIAIKMVKIRHKFHISFDVSLSQPLH